MAKKSSKKNCSQCDGEVEKVKKKDFDKLLKACFDAPPLRLKDLKKQLKKERKRKNP